MDTPLKIMAKKKFKNGDILQIMLPNDLGFAYAKGIDLLEIDPHTHYPTLIRVYNYRSSNTDESLDRFLDKELILCPILIAGILPGIRNGNYKLVGNVPVQDEEKIIPHYKRPEPDEEYVKDWYYVIDADISKRIKSSYENVKHLENLGANGSDPVRTKIAMALLLDEGKRIEDYFSLDRFYEKRYYEEVIQIPAYYKQPKSMQGQANLDE